LPAEHIAAALVTILVWHWWLDATTLVICTVTAVAAGSRAICSTTRFAATIVTAGGQEQNNTQTGQHQRLHRLDLHDWAPLPANGAPTSGSSRAVVTPSARGRLSWVDSLAAVAASLRGSSERAPPAVPEKV